MKMQVVRQASHVLRQFTPCILAAGIGIGVSVTAGGMTVMRDKWNAELQFGVIACAAVPALALIAGPLRGIPLPWRIIDCSFGVFGAIPLLLCLRHVRALEQLSPQFS